MSICDSEENRKKLAWLVPGYILLAWFFWDANRQIILELFSKLFDNYYPPEACA
jgi:hypothetical protein